MPAMSDVGKPIECTGWNTDMVAEIEDEDAFGGAPIDWSVAGFYTSSVKDTGPLCDASGNITSLSGNQYRLNPAAKNALCLDDETGTASLSFSELVKASKYHFLVFYNDNRGKKADNITLAANIDYSDGSRSEEKSFVVGSWDSTADYANTAVSSLGVLISEMGDLYFSDDCGYSVYEICIDADETRSANGVSFKAVDYGRDQSVYVLGVSAETETTGSYDYEFNATTLCDARWYGSRRSSGDHDVHSYYIVVGDKELADGVVQPGSTTYVLDMFGTAPADERNPHPAEGVYTISSEIKNGVLRSDLSHIYILDANGNHEVDRTFTAGTLTVSTSQKDGNTYYKYEADLTDNLGYSHHVIYESRFIEYADLSQASDDLEKDLKFECTDMSATYKKVEDGVMQIKLYGHTFVTDDEGEIVYDPLPGTEMFMQLYMPFGKDVANGTYTPTDDFGAAFSMQTGAIVTGGGVYPVKYPTGSYAQYVFSGRQLAWGCIKSGALTISGEGTDRLVEGDFVTDYGFKIKFTYKGAISLEKFPQSGLETDMELDLGGAEAVFDCLGDVGRLAMGVRNWHITILPGEGKNHGFIAYINSETDNFYKGIKSSVYGPSPSTVPWQNEYLRGKVNDEGQLSGTWMLSAFDENGQPQLNAPASSGDLEITRHEDGKTYTVSFDMNDGAGHNFKGTWTGMPELVNSCGDTDDSSVNEIGAEEGADVWYTIDGHRVNDMSTAGLYIIRHADGSITKHIAR